ncbi:hypothetical protein Fot_05579 [Forsythia ovata]|uniref:Uncharacterized protein n=1 Tax=Forsythia ovata TaxID=205694 RepID=A0ABD1WUJ0_9LAMI
MKEKRPCQKGAWRIKTTWRILERLSEVGRLLFGVLEKTLSILEVADNAELLEMLKLAEMYTSRIHVLNYELYKVLAMKIDELHSTVVGAEVIDELRSENKILHSRLAVSENARTKADYKIKWLK